jgi:hypothetical protein
VRRQAINLESCAHAALKTAILAKICLSSGTFSNDPPTAFLGEIDLRGFSESPLDLSIHDPAPQLATEIEFQSIRITHCKHKPRIGNRRLAEIDERAKRVRDPRQNLLRRDAIAPRQTEPIVGLSSPEPRHRLAGSTQAT